MTKEAEEHAKRGFGEKELIEAKNTADSLIFTAEKHLKMQVIKPTQVLKRSRG